MAVEIGASGGRPPVQITHLSTNPGNYVFVDTLLAVVNLTQIIVDVINYGNHVGALMVFLSSDVHNWVGTAPYSLTSTTFPSNALLNAVNNAGTVFGAAKFTQTGTNSPGSALISPVGPPGIVFQVTNGVQPNNPFCDWSGQCIFTYG